MNTSGNKNSVLICGSCGEEVQPGEGCRCTMLAKTATQVASCSGYIEWTHEINESNGEDKRKENMRWFSLEI